MGPVTPLPIFSIQILTRENVLGAAFCAICRTSTADLIIPICSVCLLPAAYPLDLRNFNLHAGYSETPYQTLWTVGCSEKD